MCLRCYTTRVGIVLDGEQETGSRKRDFVKILSIIDLTLYWGQTLGLVIRHLCDRARKSSAVKCSVRQWPQCGSCRIAFACSSFPLFLCNFYFMTDADYEVKQTCVNLQLEEWEVLEVRSQWSIEGTAYEGDPRTCSQSTLTAFPAILQRA